MLYADIILSLLMHLEHGWEKEDKKEGCFLYSGWVKMCLQYIMQSSLFGL